MRNELNNMHTVAGAGDSNAVDSRRNQSVVIITSGARGGRCTAVRHLACLTVQWTL